MKILITILLALFISSNAFAISSEKVIRDGDVIAYGVTESSMQMIVNYINKTYRCDIDTTGRPRARCRELNHRNYEEE